MVSLATALLMRSLNRSVGATVKRCGSAFSIWKLRSGIGFLFHNRGSLFQFVEKARNLLPDLGSTGKAAPVGANQSDQLVAFVDRQQIILWRSKSAGVPDAIDEQSFNVRFHFLYCWICFFNIFPGFEWQ